MHEDAGGGNGMIWGTVVHVQKGKLLEMSGTYGSPLTWFGNYDLVAHEGGNELRFTESSFGHVTEEEMACKDHGWRYLYDGCMRDHLEGGEPPAWQDVPASSC
ncbi:MAG: hypothetical protein ACI89X_004806 [Planctomycetota bacterium]|jgi:hypothetical protein